MHLRQRSRTLAKSLSVRLSLKKQHRASFCCCACSALHEDPMETVQSDSVLVCVHFNSSEMLSYKVNLRKDEVTLKE